MSLRGGSFNSTDGHWCGVLREGTQHHTGIAQYVCTHANHDRPAADLCAKQALGLLRLKGKLPKGWVRYDKNKF
jgi:hypothetical protein